MEKAISLVGQKVLKRFILNVAMSESKVVCCKPSTLLLLVRYARQLTNKKKSPSITFMPLATTYILRLSSSRSGKKTCIFRCANVDIKRVKLKDNEVSKTLF